MIAYHTLLTPCEGELVEKRSRFLARAVPVEQEAQAREFIAAVRKQDFDARHVAYAYILPDGTARSSDDGEPAGTAGRPILDVLQKRHLQGVLVTVTRWFGGILLGAGGLVRAYSGAASAALANGKPAYVRPLARVTVKLGYGDADRLRLPPHTRVEETLYTEEVTLLLLTPTEMAEELAAQIREQTLGRAVITTEEAGMAPFEEE
ncbi:MAG: YigZ family protein [Clostridia bacterium]|nr:YigZ family protein [Clostridia bacterium]